MIGIFAYSNVPVVSRCFKLKQSASRKDYACFCFGKQKIMLVSILVIVFVIRSEIVC